MNSLPKTTRLFCACVQHANHSATEPPYRLRCSFYDRSIIIIVPRIFANRPTGNERLVVLMPLSVLQKTSAALCFRLVRPYVRACVLGGEHSLTSLSSRSIAILRCWHFVPTKMPENAVVCVFLVPRSWSRDSFVLPTSTSAAECATGRHDNESRSVGGATDDYFFSHKIRPLNSACSQHANWTAVCELHSWNTC